jgi:predicted TIM-barrel fold metal-dependent hydrolase
MVWLHCGGTRYRSAHPTSPVRRIGEGDTMKQVLLKDFRPKSLLNVAARIPEAAKFPVIDAHNHLFGDLPTERLVEVMDAVGVRQWVNVTGNVTMPLVNNTYTIARRDFSVFAEGYIERYPGRFAAFTMSDFAQWDDPVLLRDGFVDDCIRHLEEDVARGACGLKVTKELGLKFQDSAGQMLGVDDPRLFPIWRRAGELGLPVLIHVSDPMAFFDPIDEHNEHYLTLQEFPGWSFVGSHFSKAELLAQRNRMIAAHPETTFILPHVANLPEDLATVSVLLDTHPNVVIDFSARIDELGRQPYTARDFFLRYQDRILFGLDMPVSVEAYRCYFRFLETRDEGFDYPDYIGRFGVYTRWKLIALDLPDDVLRKIYSANAARVIPGLASAR